MNCLFSGSFWNLQNPHDQPSSVFGLGFCHRVANYGITITPILGNSVMIQKRKFPSVVLMRISTRVCRDDWPVLCQPAVCEWMRARERERERDVGLVALHRDMALPRAFSELGSHNWQRGKNQANKINNLDFIWDFRLLIRPHLIQFSGSSINTPLIASCVLSLGLCSFLICHVSYYSESTKTMEGK